MPVVADKEEQAVEWTPELDAVLEQVESEMVAPGAPTPDPKPEPKQEAAPEQVETPEPEQPGESASAEVADNESESVVEQDDEPAALDADEIALAKSYGFTDEEIGDFASSAELARAIVPYERRLMQRQAPETNAPVAPPPKAPERKQEPEAPVDGELPELSEEEIDPTILKHLKHLQAKLDSQEQFIQQRRQAEMQAVEQERLRHFDTLVNSLGDEAKYGGEDWMKRTAEQWAARNALKDATGRMLADGRPFNSATVKRAMVYAFPEDIRKQEIAKVQTKLATQSKKRLGKPSGPKRMEVRSGDPERNPEVLQDLTRVWNEMQAESGGVSR